MYGTHEGLEATVRRVVADRLGVRFEEVEPEVSLLDDLAADSLDMADLALALEREFGVRLPERRLRHLRTCHDLLRAVREHESEQESDAPLFFLARVSGGRHAAATLERSGWFTPYAAETLADDVRRAGAEARVEVAVPAGTPAHRVSWLAAQLARLSRRGTAVSVRRGPASAPRRGSRHAPAAA